MNPEINDWFIAPDGSNQKFVNNFFSEIIQQLVDNKSQASDGELVPKAIKHHSFIDALDNQHSLEEALSKLSVIYKGSMNASSIGYIGQMDTIPNIGAIAGDLITAAINNNMLANEMSPQLSWLEQKIIDQFLDWFALGDQSGGVMTSGGTLANIQALTLARNSKLDIPSGNIHEVKGQPVFFASEHCHSSVSKAAMLLGIGHENLIKIKSDDAGRMDLYELVRQIDVAVQKGFLPFAVVSTFGTTNSGSLDDVDRIQTICEDYDLWHHVDAIYGGALVLSPNQKHLCPAFEKVDSLAFNPQKWMYVSKTCSILLFKKFKGLERYFRIAAPYVSENEEMNLGEYGIQGSRHGSVLKLWLSLYLIGRKAYAKMIDLNMEVTQLFVEFVQDHEDLELYTKPELNIILFRPINNNKDANAHSRLTQDFQNYLYENKVYISPIPWEGELWLKCIFLNPYFDKKELNKLQQLIDRYFSKS